MIKYWGLHKSNSMNLSTEHCYLKWKWKSIKSNLISTKDRGFWDIDYDLIDEIQRWIKLLSLLNKVDIHCI